MAVFTVNYTIEDNKGAKSTISIYLPDTYTQANATNFATAMAAVLDTLIWGAIRNISLSLSIDLPGGLSASPASGADVEEGGRFIFQSTGGYSTAVRLPTFPDTKILDGSRAVDLADTEVAAFVTGMVSGLDDGGTMVQPCDYRGADVEAVTSARESFQRSRTKLSV